MEIFPKVQGFQFFGTSRTFYSSAFQKVMYEDESVFDFSAIRAEMSDISDRNSIISNELLVGQSLYLNCGNRTRTAKRLAALFPNAEIVLILRDPVMLLQSLYAIDVYGGNWRRPNDYLRFPNSDGSHAEIPTFENVENVANYRYAPLLDLYKSLFPIVHVFHFEHFQHDSLSFLNHFFRQLQLPLISGLPTYKQINRSLSAAQIRLIRILNLWKPLMESTQIGRRIFQKKLSIIERMGGGGDKFKFEEELREKIKRYLDLPK